MSTETKQPTYAMIFQDDNRPYLISKTFSGSGRQQFAALYHTDEDTTNKYIKEISFALDSVSANCICPWI